MHCSRVKAFRHRAAAIIADPGRVSQLVCRLTLTRRVRKGVARDERHSPGIVADIEMGARGGEAGVRQLGGNFRLAVTLQTDT